MSEKSVRESQSLCAGEQTFIDQRKKKVLESLKKLDVKCSEDSVPHIALLGSGGGQRAALGLLGSLHQMERDKLLDSVLYLGGVSGSTWSMAYLYTDPEWSTKMGEAIDKLMNSEADMEEAKSWLKKRLFNLSLSDIWGLMTTVWIMKQMGQGHLFDEVNKNPNNPYPIYCAIERNCLNNGTKEGQWFEMSPHETGFTDLGLFVETSLLGSEFKCGELLKKEPEMDMIELQGSVLFKIWIEAVLLILPSDWGTTTNFLYKHKDSSAPENLISLENINLVDAGLLMNLPFLSFLGDKRDIDLIIALEFSAGEMFETLTLAREYAEELKKPFPEIDKKILEQGSFPEDCYVIEGKGKEPTIVYLPLFNQRNCETQEEYDDKMEKFATFQRPYDKEQTEELLKTAKENISNNSALLLEEIQKAADRRQKK